MEVILTLFSLHILYPNDVYLNRGNHENEYISFFLFLLLLLYEYYFSLIIIYLNYRFGFYKEVMNKYKNEEIFNLFKDIYSYIPIASILENRFFICHGGLLHNNEKTTINEINEINRFKDENNEIISDLLWSDPSELNGINYNPRGAGILFGEDETDKFLKHNNFDMIIRSHEYKENGYEIQHNISFFLFLLFNVFFLIFIVK